MKKGKRLKQKIMAFVLTAATIFSTFSGTVTAAETEIQPNELAKQTYTVTLEASDCGTLAFENSDENSKSFSAGEKVNMVVQPKDGYTTEQVAVADNDTGELVYSMESNETGHYSFDMPEKNIKVHADFKQNESQAEVLAEIPETEKESIQETEALKESQETAGEEKQPETEEETSEESEAESEEKVEETFESVQSETDIEPETVIETENESEPETNQTETESETAEDHGKTYPITLGTIRNCDVTLSDKELPV